MTLHFLKYSKSLLLIGTHEIGNASISEDNAIASFSVLQCAVSTSEPIFSRLLSLHVGFYGKHQ